MTRRVLMTADAVGGVWTYALELARALVPHDIAVTLATMGPAPTVEQIASAAEIDGLDLVTSTFALEWMDDPWDDIADAGEWLLAIEEDVRPSIVHLNGYAHGALPWRAPVLVVGHSCVSSWVDAVGAEIDPRWMRRYRDAVRCGVRAADWVVAPTAAMMSALQRHYGPLRCASVIPNGRDASRFPPVAKEPIIATGGRVWDRAKNVEAVHAIAPRLDWPLVVATEMSEREVAFYLARASLFVLPARYEPFGLLPLEAALAGCALVLGDIASLREVWGDAAVYVDPNDPGRLQSTVESLIADPARLARYAARARERALRYTPQAMASAYARLYSSQLSAISSQLSAISSQVSPVGRQLADPIADSRELTAARNAPR